MTDLISVPDQSREPHPVPEWVERTCRDFGVMESGAPQYRIIWNPDRTRMCFGRELRKYPRIGPRWILEVLLPWEIYGRWNEEAFGPKPADGEYCHTHTIQADLCGMMQSPSLETTEYMSMDDFGQDNLRLLLHCVEKGKAVQAWQLRNYDEDQLALEDKEFHEQFENVYDDNLAELEKVEKLSGKFGIPTSLDPIPKQIQEKRRKKALQDGKQIIH